MSYEDVANGQLVAVVTFLEMRAPSTATVEESLLSLRRIERPTTEHYRQLFRRVGAPWLWFSRLIMDHAKLAAIIQHPAVELFAVTDSVGREVGMLELDFRQEAECELAFVGFIPELAGKGHGRWLLGQALELAWRNANKRVHVHTCTLDHPAALSAYRRAGFIPYKRAIERFPDPRLLGILPRDSAPHVPLVGTDRSTVRDVSCR